MKEFSTRGYHATSVRTIAENVGISKAAVLYHSPGKPDLLGALAEPMLDALEATIGAAELAEPGRPEVDAPGRDSRRQGDVAMDKFYVLFPDKGSQAFSWYSFFGTTGIERSDLEPSQIAQMVKDAQAKYAIDPQRIFVNGLSAGAYMTTVMLATYPDVFSAGSMFAGGADGCSTSCAALGKKGRGGRGLATTPRHSS